MSKLSRRDWLKGATAAVALAQSSAIRSLAATETLPHARPTRADRHFTSSAVEALIPRIQREPVYTATYVDVLDAAQANTNEPVQAQLLEFEVQ